MLGKKIAEIRKSRGYTLSEFAEKSNISKSYLSNLERDLNQNPSIQVLIKISQVLQVNLETLLEPMSKREAKPFLEKEWLELASVIKETGLGKEDIKQYKLLIEFIKWQKEQESKEKK